MSRFVTPEVVERMRAVMFGDDTTDPREQFLREELVRYIPQLLGRSEEEIASFVEYQRRIYLSGMLPEWGRPIASLNPTFVDSIDSVVFSGSGKIYTRASVKENGYRMQIHIDDQTTAFTRQFTRYDLRMFPEILETIAKLPVMIGDAELVNRTHIHLAGFNRVELRIPDQTYWPKPGSMELDQEFLDRYLQNPDLFSNGKPHADLALTLVFHGMFAIADPSTWHLSRAVQRANLISLCTLPVNYEKIDYILDLLAAHMQTHALHTRVVHRQVVHTTAELQAYVDHNVHAGYEGTCLIQSRWDINGNPIVAPRSIKIKAYETIDCVLLGLYLKTVEDGLTEENVKGALLGLFDSSLNTYLPVTKVNLDPYGVQIKTAGQRDRLIKLRREVVALCKDRVSVDGSVVSLLDAFLLQGKYVIKYLFPADDEQAKQFETVLVHMPARSDMLSLYELYCAEREQIGTKEFKQTTVARKYVHEHRAFFRALDTLDESSRKRFFSYFSQFKHIKGVSSKLVRPSIVVDTQQPIILETLVFDIKWGTSPYAAGFHSWFGDSFCFNNCFAERVRHDKSTTTEYGVVHSLARMNTPK